MGEAEHHATLIRDAIRAARADGVNVLLDWDEDDDGVHVSLNTYTIKWDEEEGLMRMDQGPFVVERY